ncbi:MAG: hypothetical protein ABIH65_03450 [Nanoarchaeota archaeon]
MNQFEEFEFLDSSGNKTKHNCDKSKLANLHGANPNAPQFLTPVFFDKEVLDRYYNKPSEYSIQDGALFFGIKWMVRLDNNSRDCITVYLGDLGDLPHKEQLHWKFHNITQGSLSNVSLKRDFMAEFTPAQEPSLVFKQKLNNFNKKWNEKFEWDLFKPLNNEDEHHLKSLKIPKNEQKEFDEIILSLNKIIIDSLNVAEMKKHLDSKEEEKSISVLERYLKQKYRLSNIEMFNFLRSLQILRSRGSAHRKGSDYHEIYKKFDEGDFSKTFEKILIKSIWILNTLENKILESGNGK